MENLFACANGEIYAEQIVHIPFHMHKTNVYFVLLQYALDLCYTTDNLLSVSVSNVALLP